MDPHFLVFEVFQSGIPNQVCCVARFGTICTIKKCEKHPWRRVTFSTVSGLSLQLHPAMFFFTFLNCKKQKNSHGEKHP